MRLIDVKHLGRERVIGAWLVDGCLVDPGPASSLDGLLEGLGDERARAAPAHPHPPRPRGRDGHARRALARPRGLGARARRAARRRPVEARRQRDAPVRRRHGPPVGRDRPGARATNLRVLRGGERIGDWRVAYTPGHASHHVSLPARADAAPRSPATSPACASAGRARPRADAAARHRPRGVARVARPASRRGSPSALAVTHFGAWDDVAAQLAELREPRSTAWSRGRASSATRRVRASGCAPRSTPRPTPETAARVRAGDAARRRCIPGLERALRRVASTAG